MAEVIQIGEVVRFAELAWRLYELGWSDDFQADDLYRQFWRDVRFLAESLERLESVINHARQEFHRRDQALPDTVGWDQHSLVEIIGDYSSTLYDCEVLLQENRSYNATTGPMRNMYWNAFVQPRVHSLRQRILFHISKIEHVLLPFQIDLTLWIHHDLARRMIELNRRIDQQIQGVHVDVQLISQNLQTLMCAFDPSLLPEPQASPGNEMCEVELPDGIHSGLEELYSRHPGHMDGGFLDPPLRDMADAFVRSFELSTKIFNADETNREPPEDQYLNLLTCQFLMTKMLNSDEYLASSENSHWPSYIQSLQKELSDECLRFTQTMLTPQIWSETTLRPIWPEEEAPSYSDTAELPRPLELLLDMELATETNRLWKKITLYRYCESQDREFRLEITEGNVGQPASQKPTSVNIDMAKASLVPQYATPDATQPLVLILSDGQHQRRLAFRQRADMYLFQQALTGYEVVDNYTRYQLQVIFVVDGDRRVMETASLQLWRPRRLEGDSVISNSSDSGSTQRASNSTHSSGGNTSEPAGTVSTPDLEGRMRRMSLNSTSTNHVMSGARNSTGHPVGPSQTNGSGGPPRRTPTATSGSIHPISPPRGYMDSRNGQPPTPNYMHPARTPSSSGQDLHFSQAASRNSLRPNSNGPSIPTRTTSKQPRPPGGTTSSVYSPTATNPRPDSQTSPISPRTTLPPLHEESITTTASPTFTPTRPFSFPPEPSPSPFTFGSRRFSASSSRAATTTGTCSILSTASHTSQRTVTISGRATTAPTGTLHTRPAPPLLVLFTQSTPQPKPPPKSQPKSQPQSQPQNLLFLLNPQLRDNNTRPPTIMSMIAITLGSSAQVNYTVCNCAAHPHQCPVTCLQHTSGQSMTVKGIPKLDLLPFASSSPSQPSTQNGVIRVSICFPPIMPSHNPPPPEEGWSPAALVRRQFGGMPCRCPRRTEGELMACLKLGHGGKLGVVKELHRRAEVNWQRMRFENLRDVVGVGE